MNAAGYSFSGPQGIVEGTQASYAPVDGYTSDSQLGVQTGGRHHKHHRHKGSKGKSKSKSKSKRKSKHVCTEECMPCRGKTCDRDCNPCECTSKRLRSQKRKRKKQSKMRSRKGKKRTHKRAGMQGISEDSDEYDLDGPQENFMEDPSVSFFDKLFYGKRGLHLGISGNAKEPETPPPESVPKSEHGASPKPDPPKSRTKVMQRPALTPEICQLLGIQKNATDAEIKKAYKNAVRVYHPDKTRDDPDKADKEEKFKKITEYYEGAFKNLGKTKKKRRRKRTKKPKRKHA